VGELGREERGWEGRGSEVLTALETLAHGGATTQTQQAGQGVTLQAPKAGSDVTKHKSWPKNGRALSNTLHRLAPTLRAVGIEVQFTRDSGTGKRTIVLTTLGTQPRTAPPSSGPASTPPRPGRVQGGI